MDIKELLETAWHKGKDAGMLEEHDLKSQNFEEWYNFEETKKAVKNIAVLDGVSCCNTQQELEKVGKIIDSMNEGE